jgi:hypothetical protein
LMLVVLLFGLASCSEVADNGETAELAGQEQASDTVKPEPDYHKVENVDLSDFPQEWEKTAGVYKGDCIPDAQTAVSIAETYLKRFQGEDNVEKQKPFYVQVDEERGIWLIRGDNGENKLGGEYIILLNRADGKVLYMATQE